MESNVATNITKLSGILQPNSSNFNVSAQINANNTGYLYAPGTYKSYLSSG